MEELYDPSSGNFAAVDWNGNGGVAATSKLLVNGTVLAALASQERDGGIYQIVLYDPAAGLFNNAAWMVNSICRPTGTLLSDSTALIAAGPFAQIHDSANRCETAISSINNVRCHYKLR